MRILICGGAGYIGSHVARMAVDHDHEVLVLDNLNTGWRDAVQDMDFLQLDIHDESRLVELFSGSTFDLVMHFCAYSLVGESMEQPGKYYHNNVSGTLSLLRAMVNCGVSNLVFSSTAAVYGEPRTEQIVENHPKQPISPYGRSKWMVEQILQDCAQAYGLNSVCLRYFNAAGADPSGCIGEKHEPETHLIPNILKSVASGGELNLKVFGTDYPTPDGSCVRDYIHVNDLASAHLLAGEYLKDNPGARAFNLGIGKGFSVLEVIEAARRVTGQSIDYEVCGHRPGDPPVLVANASAARDQLGWTPGYTEIEAIIETAWNWHKNGERFKTSSDDVD